MHHKEPAQGAAHSHSSASNVAVAQNLPEFTPRRRSLAHQDSTSTSPLCHVYATRPGVIIGNALTSLYTPLDWVSSTSVSK